jgi:C-3',4' desaturase CrtD
MYDFIIIGAGYGGLATAALLAKEKKNVLILESHTVVGGCASYFKRKDFLFDVGATTFSGVLPHQPVGRLFRELNIQPKFKKLDPGMVIFMNGQKITRYAKKNEWINECERVFGIKNQKKFWDKVFRLNDTVYELTTKNKTLPPKSGKDYLNLIQFQNYKGIGIIPYLFKSVESILADYSLNDNNHFNSFINEQLMITTQNNRFDAPFLTAAMGLAYPSETYYPYGGMYKPAEMIMNHFTENKGEIKFKEKVISIEKLKDNYLVKTSKGNVYQSKGIVSNIPIWNMVNLTEGKIRDYFNRYSNKFASAWGAVTLNFAIEDLEELETAYYQVHSEENIPYCSSKSFFVSFSLSDDNEKAPSGWRSVTISLHTNPKQWLNLKDETYLKQKEEVTKFIVKKFDENFPNLAKGEKKFLLTGTPQSFNFYTQRMNGYVGGIPHSVKNNLLSLPKSVTPFDNLYQVGDTVFPGQGIPAVVMGALNTANRILN